MSFIKKSEKKMFSLKNILCKLMILLLIFTSACSWLRKSGHSVSGKVARDKKPLPNVNVYAYKSQSLLDFSKPDYTAKTNDAGLYSFYFGEVGDYYITAHVAKSESGELYAFYGRNPVYVPKEGVMDVNLNLQKVGTDISFKKGDKTGVKCVLTHNGNPLPNTVVYVAVDLNHGMQTTGFAQSDPSDENGESFISLEKGSYYLTARKRMKESFGRLGEGDLIGFFHKNPIVINDVGIYTVNIELVEIPKKNSSEENSPSKTAISGVVQNEEGNAVEGMWVCAYKDQQMFGKPLFLADKKTNEKGEYILHLPKGDKYYLAARNMLGGPPATGEMYGQYSATDDHSITIESGAKVTGIDIVVKEMW